MREPTNLPVLGILAGKESRNHVGMPAGPATDLSFLSLLQLFLISAAETVDTTHTDRLRAAGGSLCPD
jgi:hypothetical protein